MYEISNQDMRIINALSKNSRIKLTQLSKMLDIPISTIFEKLRNFDGKIIKKYVTLFDYAKIGYNFRVYIMLTVSPKDRDRLVEMLCKNASINNIFKVSNNYDIVADACFDSIKSAEKFFDNIDKLFNIKRKQIHYIVETIKEQGFIPFHEETLYGRNQ